MKQSGKRWFCGWLALCLLLGMVSLGLAEGDAAVELELDTQADGDGIGLEYDLPDVVRDGLVPECDAFALDLDDGLDVNGDLNPEAMETDEAASLRANASDDEDFVIDHDGRLIAYHGLGGNVTIPSGVTVIGDWAFVECAGLTDVKIPSSVTSIGEGAFARCAGLKSVTISNGVTAIGNQAFDGCTSLASVKLPASVTSMGDFVFFGCKNLEAINVAKNNTTYASWNGLLFTHDMRTLLVCPGKKTSVAIPSGVTSIGDGAFEGCASLTGVKIPAGVTSLGVNAFHGCASLTGVKLPDSVTDIKFGAFDGCASLTGITIPAGVTSIGLQAFAYCEKLEAINVAEGSRVFASRDGILFTRNMKTLCTCPGKKTSVVVPDGVTGIGEEAFWSCGKLTSVTIPASVTSIGEDAFYDCNDKLTIRGAKGSYAEAYAKQEDIKFVALIDITGAKLTVADQAYTGKALKPAVKVVLKKKTLKQDKDYTVAYKNNKAVGTATVTVIGKGDYAGSATATFKIKPKPVKGLKLAAGKGRITASWTKASGITGYQLEYGLKKNFSDGKTVTLTKASTVKRTLTGLAAGKTCYVRVRAYKKVGKATYYSVWSTAKAAKVK